MRGGGAEVMRGERRVIGMRGGAGRQKKVAGGGAGRWGGEIMYCRLINVKGAES